MRMWMVDPKVLCLQHLLGEHKEIHMWIGVLRKYGARDGNGYLQGLLDITNIKTRHDELVVELARRGYPSGVNHQTPVDASEVSEFIRLYANLETPIDVTANLKELNRRCGRCTGLQRKNGITVDQSEAA